MKKINKFLAVMLAAIMVMPMVACEGNEPTTPAPTTEVTEVTEAPTEEVVEPEVTETPEPTEEVVVEPTEEPVVGDPNIVDGYDFTDFNEDNSDENYDKVVDSMTYDSVKFIIHRVEYYQHSITGILSDGDKYYVPNDGAAYYYYFYFPKAIKTVEVDGMSEYMSDTPTYLYDQEGKNGYSANVRDDSIITEDGYELTGHVVYTDGTEETIVITLYPEK